METLIESITGIPPMNDVEALSRAAAERCGNIKTISNMYCFNRVITICKDTKKLRTIMHSLSFIAYLPCFLCNTCWLLSFCNAFCAHSPSEIPNRWYSYMPPVSEIIGTGCSCYYAHGVCNLVCTVCVCSHLPSPPQEEKRHKVKMPCASMLKCQCLTSVVNVSLALLSTKNV